MLPGQDRRREMSGQVEALAALFVYWPATSKQRRDGIILDQHASQPTEIGLNAHLADIKQRVHDRCQQVLRSIALGGGMCREAVRLSDDLAHLEPAAGE